MKKIINLFYCLTAIVLLNSCAEEDPEFFGTVDYDITVENITPYSAKVTVSWEDTPENIINGCGRCYIESALSYYESSRVYILKKGSRYYAIYNIEGLTPNTTYTATTIIRLKYNISQSSDWSIDGCRSRECVFTTKSGTDLTGTYDVTIDKIYASDTELIFNIICPITKSAGWSSNSSTRSPLTVMLNKNGHTVATAEASSYHSTYYTASFTELTPDTEYEVSISGDFVLYGADDKVIELGELTLEAKDQPIKTCLTGEKYVNFEISGWYFHGAGGFGADQTLNMTFPEEFKPSNQFDFDISETAMPEKLSQHILISDVEFDSRYNTYEIPLKNFALRSYNYYYCACKSSVIFTDLKTGKTIDLGYIDIDLIPNYSACQ